MPQKIRKMGFGALRGFRPFSDLEPATLATLEEICRRDLYRAGETVVHEGEASRFVGLVVSGILRLQRSLTDGRRPIVGLLVEGDLFGRLFEGPMDLAIEAATDAVILAFPRLAFEELLDRSPDLDRLALLNMLNELDRARDWMVILSNQKVSSRVAGFLLVMCARYATVDHLLTSRADGIEVRIPISRVDLAHLLGTRPESISRALHWLADAGDIEIVRPDRILIRDPAALAVKAGEDVVPTIDGQAAFARAQAKVD